MIHAVESDVATVSIEGPVRLVGTLGTRSFCTGLGGCLLGWNAEETVLYLARRYDRTLRIWSMDVGTGEFVAERELSSAAVIDGTPAGPGHAVIHLAEAGEGRRQWYGLLDLERGVLVGEVDRREAASTTLALSHHRYVAPPWQAYVADAPCRRPGDAAESADGRGPGAVSPDGAWYLRPAGPEREEGVDIFDASGARVGRMRTGAAEAIHVATFALDGTLFVGLGDGTLGGWDAHRESWRWRERRHRAAVVSLVRAPDGRTFFSYGEDERLCATGADGEARWETALRRAGGGSERHRWTAPRILASPSGSLVAVGTGHSIRVLDAASGADRTVLDGHEGFVTCLKFSRDGALLASGALDGDVRLWDVAAGTARWTLENDGDEVGAVEFRPDRPSLLVHDRSGRGIEWDLRTGLELSRQAEHPDDYFGVVAVTDGDRVLVVSGPHHRMWSGRTPERADWSYESPAARKSLTQFRIRGARTNYAGYSRDGTRVLLTALYRDSEDGSSCWLETLDAETGRPLDEPRALPGGVIGIVATDEQTLIVVTTPDEMLLLDEQGAQRLGRLPVPADPTLRNVGVSQDQTVIAWQTDARVEVWRLGRQPTRVAAITLSLAHEYPTAMALSSDGRTLAVGTSRGCVLLFEVDLRG